MFIIQNLLAILSLVWIALQRLATPPDYKSPSEEGSGSLYTPLCSLHDVAGKSQWASFGQLLPMILLLLPILSAYGTYVGKLMLKIGASCADVEFAEERDRKRVTGYASIPVSRPVAFGKPHSDAE